MGKKLRGFEGGEESFSSVLGQGMIKSVDPTNIIVSKQMSPGASSNSSYGSGGKLTNMMIPAHAMASKEILLA